ncbi:MAG: amidohydrolase family protein [Thermomicrobiales bacterium]|nr:amidohydrolase family protein [Thermomicrobiales bacterium]
MESSNSEITLREYAPRPMLTVPAHEIDRPRFDVIDAHNHLGGGVFGDSDYFHRWPVEQLLALMDSVSVRMIFDLDGGWGERLRSEIAHYQEPHPDRFAVFAGLDYDNFASDPNFGETEARRLRDSVAQGARGLKAWKVLGLRLRDTQGRLIPIDDERLGPLWETAGELDVPVLIHIADPVAFFEPLDRFNERWEELQENPDWHFYPIRPKGDLNHPDFPSFQELMDQFENLLTRHAKTTFIGAHVGCYAENLGWVGRVMDKCPNFYADISARIQELGRQPVTAHEFFVRHQDRILFGTDAAPDVAVYRLYYRFLETRDEYINSDTRGEMPGNGRWMIYGLDLPDDVLRKVYYDNAHRLITARHASEVK